MSRDVTPTDTLIAEEDEASYDANVRACAKHLEDLKRVHGEPPQGLPRVSLARYRPMPATYAATYAPYAPPRGV